jgi:regulation of enolase protein 1 (concanavalin A-like superfamily)
MNHRIDVPGLPFALTPSHPDVWRRDEQAGAVIAQAPARTDLYINPAGAGSADAETRLDAATLLGTPPGGDFQLSARVRVDFLSQFDAGVLLLWADEQNWAKLCFEFSPASEPMVVSVVTRRLSDDANAFVTPDRSVGLRVARVDGIYAFHASTDGQTWQLVRVFSLGDDPDRHQIGLEAQAPTGEGCTVIFDQLRFTQQRLLNLRDGS